MLCASVKLSGITIRPPFGSRACAATTDSSSDKSRTGAAIASTAKEGAAALKELSQNSAYVAAAGLNTIVTLATRGAISLSSSSHLPPSASSLTAKPVTLPPGRGKLATKPLPTGSATVAKTIGMLRVEFFRELSHQVRFSGRRPASVNPNVATLRPPELVKSVPDANQRDEFASPHSITSSARASTVAGTSISNDLAVL